MRSGYAAFLAAALMATPNLAAAQTPSTGAAPLPAEPTPSQNQAVSPPPEVKAVEAKPAGFKHVTSVYGTANVNFQNTRANGATAGQAADVSNRNAISTDSSNIGVRSALQVNEWLSATFQCETQANVNGWDLRALCNRNSRLGIAGPWGTLFYGNWDTPFKASAYGTKADDAFGNTDVFGFQGLLSSPGFNARSGAWNSADPGATPATNKSFDLRAGNSVAFHTGKLYGLSAKVQYAVNEFKSVNGAYNPRLWGAVLNYDYGPISVFGAFERHEDGFGLAAISAAAVTPGKFQFGATAANTTAATSTDDAWRVGAGYELKTPIGATTVGGAFEQLKLQQDGAPTGAITEYKRNAWQVNLKHRLGPHELRGRYSKALAGDCKLAGGAACSTDEYGAQMITVGYGYFFAPSFQAYLFFAQILNDANAQYTFTVGGAPNVAGKTARGADPQAMGLGLRYAFQ